MQVDSSHIPQPSGSSSPIQSRATYTSPNASSRVRPTKDTNRAVSDRVIKERLNKSESLAIKPLATHHDSNPTESMLTNLAWQSGPSSPRQLSSRSDDAKPRDSHPESKIPAPDSGHSQPRSISSSRSSNALTLPNLNVSGRPRSKSNASSSRAAKPQSSSGPPSSATNRSAVTPDISSSSVLSNKQPTAAPSKPSLRSRIFGLKSPKVASPSASSFASSTETSSPRSARFTPSIHSEASRSDPYLAESSMPSPSFPDSSHATQPDAVGDTDEAHGDADSRKSNAASNFLRKTIRFKDKSAFQKARPSVSSMDSESTTSASTSVPPAPLDPPGNSDAESPARKMSPYKQVSGRRGLQYNGTSADQWKLATPGSTTQPRSRPPADLAHPQGSVALLPAVTERDLESLPNLVRPLSQRSLSTEHRHEKRHSNSARFDDASPSSFRHIDAAGRISRSSSVNHPAGRSNSNTSPSSYGASHQSASPSVQADGPRAPRQRPRSGSASSFAPRIQPRTTSSPIRTAARRPTTASPSPAASPSASAPATDRPNQRTSRPKTAETGHAYSNSMSSLRDILMVAHAISEEGAIYNTPERDHTERFESGASPSVAADVGASPSDKRRPGLPPKNPLRRQRPSTASVIDTPSLSGDSPVSAHTSGVFAGPSSKLANARLLGPAPATNEALGPIPSPASASSTVELRTPTPGLAQPSPMERKSGGDYFRSRDLARLHDAPAGPPSRSPTWTNGSGSPTSAQSPYARSQQLSRAPSSDTYGAGIATRHGRSTSDASLLLTDRRPSIGPSASTTSLQSESSSGTKKKKDSAGSKMLAFARDLARGESSSEASPIISSSGTFRLARSSKSKKADATPRPVIRRLYDGPLEGDAAALAANRATDDAVNSTVNSMDSVSPGSSVVDLHAAAGPGTRTPNITSNGDPHHRSISSDGLARSVVSSGGTARDLMTPGSGHLLTPRLGLNGRETLAPRSPSSAQPPWSIPQDDLTAEQKRLVKRWFVLRELLETEKTYASDLAVARDIYLARAKMRAGITAPLSPLSVRSASVFSQLASPEPPTQSQSSASHPHHRGSVSAFSHGTALGRGALPQRTLFRHASADVTSNAAPASPGSINQTASSASLASSNPSNRSSMYTVSSQSSYASDASQLHLTGHAALAGGLPTQFSIDGNTLSPMSAHKSNPGTPASGTAPNPSPRSSTSTAAFNSTTTGILSPSFAGSLEGLAAGLSEAPFSASDVRIVFAQLESCAAFADEMVVLLEDAVGKICSGTAEEALHLLVQGKINEESETDRVGQIFLKMMPRIEQVYSAYCSRHEVSMARLQELLNTQPKVASFLSECTRAARAYTNAWDLSSLLIKPVQRVLKYPLLLSQILAWTTSKHPDLENLSAASIEIQKVADNINEVKKRKDIVEQIVSGKMTKRTTSQRMQHGATKKLLRRQEKVKMLVLGPAEDILADGGQYKALVLQFQQLEKSTGSFARRCVVWSSSIKNAHVAQLKLLEQWSSAYAAGHTAVSAEAEARLRIFSQLVDETLLNEYWAKLDSEINLSLKPAIERVSAMFSLPQSVISKRDDREPDYSRYRTEIARGGSKAVDKKLTESANAFVALHTQLMNELPQFNYGVQTLLDLCIESLARTQASYHLRVYQALVRFWQTYGPEGNSDIVHNEETDEKTMRHVNPVKIFWPLHSNMTEFAQSLGIVMGTVGDLPSRSTSVSVDSEVLTVGNMSPVSTNHFSPLQSTQMLPDPDFASRVPDATSMSQQVESITAAGSEELLVSSSGRTSPGSFTTPPLGSQRRSSLSPRIRQGAFLGSPAPIGSAPSDDAPQQRSLRTSKSGGLIGLLRSVGSTQGGVGPRKGSQSFDTANESLGDGGQSDPPTPVSKDTPLLGDASGNGVSVPMLPALTFNSGFFGQSDAVFDSASAARGLGVEAARRKSRTLSASSAMGTMAAVANSPARLKGTTKNGYPFIDYAAGDLIRVLDKDKAHLLGTSESGITGWVERENFVPLS